MQEKILQCLIVERNVPKAIQMIGGEISKGTLITDKEGLEDLQNDYCRMRDFMMQGYRDAQIESVYIDLLKRTYRLYANMVIKTRHVRRGLHWDVRGTREDFPSQISSVRDALEAFVQDIALSSLQAADRETGTPDSIYRTHQKTLEEFFGSILDSLLWTENTQRDMSSLILSPTIDTIDAQAIVSAVMLATMTVFDIHKWHTLVSVYLQTQDERVRQRALVGWVLSLPQGVLSEITEIKETIDHICEDPLCRHEIQELQMQLFYCCNTDADNAKIQRDILPTLIKNNNLRMTRTGIVEQEDKLRDILHPEASEQEMEQLEQTFQRIKEMQEAGTDIYFGGFAQMKRFPFFYHLVNWFCPFYKEHPMIKDAISRIDGDHLAEIIESSGPFCDSDKYSFVLGLASILDKLPDNIREMLRAGAATGHLDRQCDTTQPAYIRRAYLQDLYRFFRLYPNKHDFPTPFGWDDRAFFFLRPPFRAGTLSRERDEIAVSLYVRGHHEDVVRLYGADIHPDSREATLALAQAYIKQGHYEEARILLDRILKTDPTDEHALRGMGRIHFAMGSFDRAGDTYEILTHSHPENTIYRLNEGISFVNAGRQEKGMAILYKLYYEHPSDHNVIRALAWGTLLGKRPADAERLYLKLAATDHVSATDHLNIGYARWFSRHVTEAVTAFREYLSHTGKRPAPYSILQDFSDDRLLLDAYGITYTEQIIMADAVSADFKC